MVLQVNPLRVVHRNAAAAAAVDDDNDVVVIVAAFRVVVVARMGNDRNVLAMTLDAIMMLLSTQPLGINNRTNVAIPLLQLGQIPDCQYKSNKRQGCCG